MIEVERPAPIFQRRNSTRVVVKGRGTRIPAASSRSTAVSVTTTTSTTTKGPPANEVVEVRPTRRTIRRRPTRIQASQQPETNTPNAVQSERKNPVFSNRRPTTSKPEPTTTVRITTTFRTTQRPTTTSTTTTTTTTEPPTTEQQTNHLRTSSEEVNEEIASVLPAITSARPRQSQKSPSQSTNKNNQFTFDSPSEGFVPFIPNYIESTAQPLIREQQQQVPYEQYLKQQYKIKGLDIESTEEEPYNEDEKLIGVLGSQVKVILHSHFSNDPESVLVECLDIGNYPHPMSCTKYIQCANMRGYLQGHLFACSAGMNFDPVIGMCTMESKLGCTRNNVRLLNKDN